HRSWQSMCDPRWAQPINRNKEGTRMRRLFVFAPVAMALLINGVPVAAQQSTRGSNPDDGQKAQDDMQKRMDEQKKIIADLEESLKKQQEALKKQAEEQKKKEDDEKKKQQDDAEKKKAEDAQKK